MEEIIKMNTNKTSVNKHELISSQIVYPYTDQKVESFLVVINLPNIDYDEIIVTIDDAYVDVSASIASIDRLTALFEERQDVQIYNTKLRIPEGLDITHAEAFYRNGAVTVYVPYKVIFNK